MSNVQLAIIYYSTYGTNLKMAMTAAEAARAAGADVRVRKVKETAPDEVVDGQVAWKTTAENMAHVPEATYDDMEWANAYLFSAPTRYGVYASQMRTFIVSPGYTDPIQYKAGGNPYGVTVTANGEPIPDDVTEAIKYQARRLVSFAEKLIA